MIAYNKPRSTDNEPKTTYYKPELMCPAGDGTMLRAVVQSGADAVYFGLDRLNMRAKASNFSIEELHEVTGYCKENKVLSYLTLNTIVFEDELDELELIIAAAKDKGVDRIICSDLAVAAICSKYKMPFCVSTQSSVSNSASAEVYKQLGAVRIVLARECSLAEIKKIRQKTDLEFEAFVHGAMCIAVSGRCFMSHHLFGKSANRGECVQPCRREYEVYDTASDKSMMVGDDYVLSPKDLCTIEYLDKLIEAGIDSFKIEGRKRSTEYAAKTSAVYRKAIDSYFENNFTDDLKKELLTELQTVYNRGFSTGFYFGIPTSEDYTDVEGSKATTRKIYLGKVVNYYKEPAVAHILIEAGEASSGDALIITGETTGLIEITLKDFMINDLNVSHACKGSEITLVTENLVRRNDRVYKIETVSEIT